MSDEGQRVVRFNQEHYDLLMKCAKKGDMAEWNEWYGKYKKAQKDAGKDDCGAWLDGANMSWVHLEGADMSWAHLERANMIEAHLERADMTKAHMDQAVMMRAKMTKTHLQGAQLEGAHLEQADLQGAQLEGANMPWVHLERAFLIGSDLEGAIMYGAQLERAIMYGAQLEGASLSNANLKHAILSNANLEGVDMSAANLAQAHLQRAQLEGANMPWVHLEGADLGGTHLEGASFYAAWLNEKTDLLGCTYDSETNFTATSLTSAHIEPDTLTALQKNIRRKYWVMWYDQHKILQYPCRLFWWLSDYGTSSTRCIGAFALLILAACVIYFFITGAAIADIPQLFADTILATFGFGSLFDQLTGPIRLLLAAHVLAGYFLLAVLITRFAVMFQSLTP